MPSSGDILVRMGVGVGQGFRVVLVGPSILVVLVVPCIRSFLGLLLVPLVPLVPLLLVVLVVP